MYENLRLVISAATGLAYFKTRSHISPASRFPARGISRGTGKKLTPVRQQFPGLCECRNSGRAISGDPDCLKTRPTTNFPVSQRVTCPANRPSLVQFFPEILSRNSGRPMFWKPWRCCFRTNLLYAKPFSWPCPILKHCHSPRAPSPLG